MEPWWVNMGRAFINWTLESRTHLLEEFRMYTKQWLLHANRSLIGRIPIYTAMSLPTDVVGTMILPYKQSPMIFN
jgi:hypothetical protein